jgi:hypothetical protein
VENDNELLVKSFTQEINYFEFREILTDDIHSEVFDVSNCFPADKDRNHFDLFLKSDGMSSTGFHCISLPLTVFSNLQATRDLITALL